MMQMSNGAKKVPQLITSRQDRNNTTIEVRDAFNRISAHEHPSGEPQLDDISEISRLRVKAGKS